MQDERITNPAQTFRPATDDRSRPAALPRLRRRLLGTIAAIAAMLSGGAVMAAPASAVESAEASTTVTVASDATSTPLDAVGTLLVERLQLADTVAQAKWIKGTPVSDPAREKVVIDAAVAQASRDGVDPDLVRRVMTDQISASKVVQRGLLTHWAHNPSEAPTAAPDLTTVRTRLDEIDAALVDALGAAQPTAADPTCRHLVDHERDREYPGLDSLHRKAVHTAWSSFCVPLTNKP
ncbi:gamma subclass chorismate mutase AroQ [Microbacterium sp. VKM Ac-2870]|uniref:gamma subclass chorismate mutase AroQ n=1 Tax=Microbacterium sp. VKM Ac-2870 TaxID=2783825 RepID=UPI00188C179B|nr:gamma subclass chorismate mutase AroQ [Microbacterium sp. VKM Ac-2870]MBF4563320.1 gamma subclass chorismate mutase AroQ [Microbacterium sp. VKM Ac-2870]